MPRFDKAWFERTERDPYSFWIIEALEGGATLKPQDDYEQSYRWRLAYPDDTAVSVHVSTLINLRHNGYINYAFELPSLTEKAVGILEYRREKGVTVGKRRDD